MSLADGYRSKQRRLAFMMRREIPYGNSDGGGFMGTKAGTEVSDRQTIASYARVHLRRKNSQRYATAGTAGEARAA